MAANNNIQDEIILYEGGSEANDQNDTCSDQNEEGG